MPRTGRSKGKPTIKTDGTNEKLALLGGVKTVTQREAIEEANRWPVFGDEECEAVNAALRGKNVYASTAEFEKEFGAYHGAT